MIRRETEVIGASRCVSLNDSLWACAGVIQVNESSDCEVWALCGREAEGRSFLVQSCVQPYSKRLGAVSGVVGPRHGPRCPDGGRGTHGGTIESRTVVQRA